MARPTKQGLDYFPLDVGLFEDIKIRRLKKDCGNQAISILIAIFCIAYRDEGYYVEINSDVTFLIAETFGVSEDAVEKIVEKAIQVGIFDSGKFNTYKILTSRGIQERYFAAASRKTAVLVHRDFVCDGVNVCNNAVYVDNNPINVFNNPQSKVKESKGKESKGEKRAPEERQKKRGEYGNVLLSDVEIQKLKENGVDVDRLIERLDLYIGQSGKRYKSHYMTILNWDKRDEEQAAPKAKGYGGVKKPVGAHVLSDTRMSAEEKAEWAQKKLEASKTASLRGE